MFLKDAIKGLIAGIGVCTLLPAFVLSQPAIAAERNGDRVPGKPVALSLESADKPAAKAKPSKLKERVADQADDFLRDEFSDSAILIEPAAVVQTPDPQQFDNGEIPPRRGYGNFEGVVLVAPEGRGLVLVEPAAQTDSSGDPPPEASAETGSPPTEPVMETAEEIDDIPEDLGGEEDDPLESINRLFFQVNEVVDHLVLAPAARVYHVVVPEPLRLGVSNAVRNVRSPVILANDILQGERQRASDTIVRFMVNSTIGLGGLIDAAGYMGVQYHSEDFGQTLAVWGVGSGPYLVVPLLGPSNPRDLGGLAVDASFNPLTWVLFDQPLEIRMAPSAVELVVGRESILDDYATLRATSPDIYASVRDIYLEKRQAEIANGDITGEPIPGVTSLPGSSVTVKPF